MSELTQKNERKLEYIADVMRVKAEIDRQNKIRGNGNYRIAELNRKIAETNEILYALNGELMRHRQMDQSYERVRNSIDEIKADLADEQQLKKSAQLELSTEHEEKKHALQQLGILETKLYELLDKIEINYG